MPEDTNPHPKRTDAVASVPTAYPSMIRSRLAPQSADEIESCNQKQEESTRQRGENPDFQKDHLFLVALTAN